jgi:integrase/recombinase XerD
MNSPVQTALPSPPPAVGPPALSDQQFAELAEVPAEGVWLANIINPCTRRAYQQDLADFMTFVGIRKPEDFRRVVRSHVIVWRKSLEKRKLEPASIRRKLSALSALYKYLCEENCVLFNPTLGVKRPSAGANEGKTPAIGDDQARALLTAPSDKTIKGKRDRAVLATFLFHALRCAELCALNIKDLEQRSGVMHLRVHGKGGKIRFIPVHAAAQQRITEYLAAAGHGDDPDGPLFRPVKNSRNGELRKPLSEGAVYARIVKFYAKKVGIDLSGFGPHSLRATAATNALDHQADIAKVQEWLGHANISTTKMYDRRKTKPEDSPTFKVAY